MSIKPPTSFMSQNTQIVHFMAVEHQGGIREWRRWGSGEKPSWLECCCSRAERTNRLKASQSDLWPVRSASTEPSPLHGPTDREHQHSQRYWFLMTYYNNRELRLYSHTYIIVVTAALSTEGRLVVALALEIVLTKVPERCAHLSMLQLFLLWKDFIQI